MVTKVRSNMVTHKKGNDIVGLKDELDLLDQAIVDRPLPFDSVEDLKASELAAGEVVARYYYEKGDKGYLRGLVKTAAQAITDGEVIDEVLNVTLANGNKWIGFRAKPLNVFQFGAYMDGTTDDLTTFQRASDFVGQYGGGKLVVPNGVARFKDNFVTGVNQTGWLLRYNNLKIDFESRKAILRADSDAQRKVIAVAADTNSNPASIVNGIRIKGGTVDGQNNAVGAVTNESSHGIDVRRCRDVRVKDMGVIACRGDQVFIGYGAQDVIVEKNDLNGNKNASISGVRQGVSVLSGNNIRVLNNNIQQALLGVDVELDDNQISFGHNYVQKIRILENTITDMSSEGIGVITPLVSSTCVIEDIKIKGNILKDIDETLIDVDIDATAGQAENITISDNSSEGSNTFKGINLAGVVKSTIADNKLGDNTSSVIAIGARCDELNMYGNDGTTNTGNGIDAFENNSTSRLSLTFGANNIRSLNGVGMRLNGAWKVDMTGGYYRGATAGFTSQGSTASGDNTRIRITKNGGLFEATGVGGVGAIIQDNNKEYSSVGANYISASGEPYAIQVANLVSGSPRITSPVITIGTDIEANVRQFIDDQSSLKLQLRDTQPWFNTSAELNDINHYSNNVGKEFFSFVWNTTINKPVYALAGSAAGVWVDAAGAVVNTPV